MAQRSRAFSRAGSRLPTPTLSPWTSAVVHNAAVPADATQEPVRQFNCFTADLSAMAEWFEECGVKIVAMEFTGVYWIPLYEAPERRRFARL
jgi:hypothetical protein